MGSPLDYGDTVELLNAGVDTRPQQEQEGMELQPIPITVVCNDPTQTYIKADANGWGWDQEGLVIIEGVWSYDQFAVRDDLTKLPRKEDCLIPRHTIHHITYHFDELQKGTNPND